jgi:acetyl esterase/lipase
LILIIFLLDMPFTLDPEIGAILPAVAAATAGAPLPPLAVGDVKSRRDAFAAWLAPTASANFPKKSSITTKDYYAQSLDGHEVLLRWYSKRGTNPGSAVLYLHPGGLILGDISVFDGVVQSYVAKSGVSYLSVEYRLAPEHPYPKPLEDAYAGLVWLHEHATELGVNRTRIAVHGESAGGGLAAALAIYTLEKQGPAIAKQILIYPMLDDRVIKSDPHITPYVTWSGNDNETGWNAYIGSKRGSADLPATASPARLKDPAGLPPLYIDVGELDLFRDEAIAYADKFRKAGVSAELHIYPGVPHGFDLFAPHSKLGSAAITARLMAVESIPTLRTMKLEVI